MSRLFLSRVILTRLQTLSKRQKTHARSKRERERERDQRTVVSKPTTPAAAADDDDTNIECVGKKRPKYLQKGLDLDYVFFTRALLVLSLLLTHTHTRERVSERETQREEEGLASITERVVNNV